MTQDDRQFFKQMFEEQTLQFQRHVSAVAESFDLNLGLIAEGYATLDKKIDDLAQRNDERFDLVDFKIDTLNKKIDAVATDLKAHRSDTEAHHGVYRVKE